MLNDVYASVVLSDAMQIPDRDSKNRAQDQAVDARMSYQQNISLRAGNNLGQCAGDSRATIGKALRPEAASSQYRVRGRRILQGIAP
jgi:hypothetical protein